MASSSLLTDPVHPSSGIKKENHPSSPPISPQQSSLQQLSELWFGITSSSTHHRRPSPSHEGFQAIPRPLMPSNSIVAAGYSLQSITDTTPGIFPAANSQVPSVEAYRLNSLVNTLNESEMSAGSYSNNSPPYNPNATGMYHGSYYDSPVYAPNPNGVHNVLYTRDSPVYNPIPKDRYHEFSSNDSPVYDPNSRQMSNDIFSNNNNVNDRDCPGSSEVVIDWETLLVACYPKPTLMLPSSDLTKALKRSRSFDSPSSILESHNSNLNVDLDPGLSKKLKTSN